MAVTWKPPETTEYMKAQNKHERTLEYARELYSIAPHGQIKALEIGCAWGVSALSFLSGNQELRLTSVDVNPNNHAIEEVRVNGFSERWQFYLGKSEEFFEQNTEDFNMIYIDGSHKYPTCRDDMIAAWQALKPRGVLIIDDYIHPKNQEVEADGTVEYGVSFGLCELLSIIGKARITAHKYVIEVRHA